MMIEFSSMEEVGLLYYRAFLCNYLIRGIRNKLRWLEQNRLTYERVDLIPYPLNRTISGSARKDSTPSRPKGELAHFRIWNPASEIVYVVHTLVSRCEWGTSCASASTNVSKCRELEVLLLSAKPHHDGSSHNSESHELQHYRACGHIRPAARRPPRCLLICSLPNISCR